MTCWVYILASQRNGTLYVGVTTDLLRRVQQHRDGAVPGFTRTYGVTGLVFAEEFASLHDAREAEARIKRWRREWKLDLIERTNQEWSDLFDHLV